MQEQQIKILSLFEENLWYFCLFNLWWITEDTFTRKNFMLHNFESQISFLKIQIFYEKEVQCLGKSSH